MSRRKAQEAFEEYAETRDRILGHASQRADWAGEGPAQGRNYRDEADKNIREKWKARADRQAAKAARVRRSADRIEEVAQPRKEWELRYAIDSGPAPVEVVWTLDQVEVAERGDFRLGPVDLVVARGERWGLVGDETGRGRRPC